MNNQNKLIVSHAPFWHDGSQISIKNYNIMSAALPAIIYSFFLYGTQAIGVVALSVSSAIIWELLMNYATNRPISIGDGNAALIGLIFAMLLPATVPWWLVITGTFVSIVIGKMIFGGIGSNPFNPVLIGVAILMISWGHYFDFDSAYVNYEFDFTMRYPLAAVKYFGAASAGAYGIGGLLMGKQLGAIGATFGLGLIIGGLYLILRGFIRWEISLSFIMGIVLASFLFNLSDSAKYAGPMIHLFSGYTLIGAFFLATEDSSSPVNFFPMIIYGLCCGIMTIAIRNIGNYVDGVVLAILLMNLINPLIDKIKPKAMGKGVANA